MSHLVDVSRYVALGFSLGRALEEDAPSLAQVRIVRPEWLLSGQVAVLEWLVYAVVKERVRPTAGAWPLWLQTPPERARCAGVYGTNVGISTRNATETAFTLTRKHLSR